MRRAELEQELDATRQRLAEAAAPPPERMIPDGCAVTISREELSALEREREALEAELELVRNRAAELNETVAEQQRAITDQKTELSTELQQLRLLVEKQADLFATRVEERERAAPAAEPETKEQPPAADPVVNSVMAQFAKLQRDVLAPPSPQEMIIGWAFRARPCARLCSRSQWVPGSNRWKCDEQETATGKHPGALRRHRVRGAAGRPADRPMVGSGHRGAGPRAYPRDGGTAAKTSRLGPPGTGASTG